MSSALLVPGAGKPTSSSLISRSHLPVDHREATAVSGRGIRPPWARPTCCRLPPAGPHPQGSSASWAQSTTHSFSVSEPSRQASGVSGQRVCRRETKGQVPSSWFQRGPGFSEPPSHPRGPWVQLQGDWLILLDQRPEQGPIC